MKFWCSSHHQLQYRDFSRYSSYSRRANVPLQKWKYMTWTISSPGWKPWFICI